MRLFKLSIILAFSFLFASAGVQSEEPSFDCDAASTPTEFAICSSDELSVLDRALSDAYLSAMLKIAENKDLANHLEAARSHRNEQREWNNWEEHFRLPLRPIPLIV